MRKGTAEGLISRIQRQFEYLDDSSILIELDADPISDLEIFEHFNGDDVIQRGMALRHLKHDLFGFKFNRHHRPAQQAGGDGHVARRQTQEQYDIYQQ